MNIDQVDLDAPQPLLYVAMSHARSLLILMISEATGVAFERQIQTSMKQEIYG